MVGNLGQAWISLGRLSKILIQEGAYLKVLGSFYKAVVQAVLLFRAETWLLTPRVEQTLDRLQHRAAQRITGKQLRRRGDLGVPASGGGNGGSSIKGDQKVGHKEAEQGRAVYCDATNSVPL